MVRNSLVMVLLLLVLAVPGTAQAYSSILTCTIEHSADTNDPGNITTFKHTKPLVVMFANLDGDVPVVKGNVDEVPLFKLAESEDGILYLVESTPAGNIVYYSVYRQQKMVTISKDYVRDGKPVSYKMVGSCI